MKVLVKRGPRYIISQVVHQLDETGHDAIIYDNLSTGNRWAILHKAIEWEKYLDSKGDSVAHA